MDKTQNGSCFGIIIIVVLFAVSLYYTIQLVGGIISNEAFNKDAVLVDAVCEGHWTEKEYHSSDEGRGYYSTEHYVSINYRYNGKKYRNTKLHVKKTYQQGSVITVYVMPSNPSDCRMEKSSSWWYLPVMVIVLPLFLVSSIAMGRMILWKLGLYTPKPLPQKQQTE